jgi:dephospho-CoA kinase
LKSSLLIGITGGIGSGKTTLSNLLRTRGYQVYDADGEARRLQHENETVRRQMIDLFGNKIYNSSGLLNRPLLAEIAFSDTDKLQQLNNIVHPAVKLDFEKWIEKYNSEKILFMESAILFESGFFKLFDKIIAVAASKETRIERVMLRDNTTREQTLERMSQQLPEKELLTRADFIVWTDTSQSLDEQVKNIIEEVIK